MHGAPLPFDRRGGAFKGAARETVANVLSDIGMLTGPTALGVRAVAAISRAIRQRSVQRRALADCPVLADVIDSMARSPEPEDLVQLAWLLSWGCEQQDPTDRPVVICFVDTYEDLTIESERRTERSLNSLAHLLPHVLWVVTGRNSLDWTSRGVAALLEQTGPATWPGLVPGSEEEPRQHRPPLAAFAWLTLPIRIPT